MEGIQEASKRDASGSDLECSPAPKRPLYCRTATFYFVMALLVDPLCDNVRYDIGHDRHNKTDKICFFDLACVQREVGSHRASRESPRCAVQPSPRRLHESIQNRA